ncbi:MAG: catalase HPII [Pedobacter sp.]|uniref:catalase HPII n=1 Tax=Pedobacter sp. TaxID=1411316 RepID=UPI003392DD5A
MKDKKTSKLQETTPAKSKNAPLENAKQIQLQSDKEHGGGEFLTTNQGIKINDNQNSLKAGERGATLLEDFILREKITHFDHERIPERIVHARGSGAHGVFELYKPIPELTKAGFLNDTSVKTPVFVRFSTVAGSRGSTDMARDVRGFAVKFYTQEGNFDLVGNNMPVFFIQDAIKFPDLVHAVKPEPHNEIPQAASAHDTFWDFISLMPESTHMIMWLMSDRALPRSYRMMEGFGVHTFRLITAEGKSSFVKFHWKPLLGVHSVAWDEAKKISGNDPDFHRRDLWDAIDAGALPEWEFGVQIISEEDEHKFDFDILDPTKLIPEELVPVQKIGKMTLNRNPDNFFAETEQVAFHIGHVVPGIDFTNDPLLQGRLFSYTDTQLLRLGGPNFHEIPINRPVSPVHNNQRDGHMRQTINTSRTSYEPNSISANYPKQATVAEGGFNTYEERIDARKIRDRSESFFDHFSQATMFYNSQAEHEKNHIVDALRFELGKVDREDIRKRMVGILTLVDGTLAKRVADGLGLEVPEGPELPINHGVPADADPAKYESRIVKSSTEASAALSMANTPKDSIKSRMIAILATDGVNSTELNALQKALQAGGAMAKIVATHNGHIKDDKGLAVKVDFTFLTSASVLFDAVYIPGGAASVKSIAAEADALHFVTEAFKHCKAIGAASDAEDFIKMTQIPFGPKGATPPGVILNGKPADFIAAVAQHRFWEREKKPDVPA